MDNRNCSHPRGGAGRAGGARLGMAVSAVMALGACSSVPDAVNPVEWYKSAEQSVFGGGTATADADAAAPQAGASAYTPPEIPGRDQPFPNLGGGPERPVSRTPAETGRLTEGLVADRARVRHSDQRIPLQGMSGERSAGSPMITGGELPLVAAPPSSAEVIRTQIGQTPAARAEGGPQRSGEPRRSAGVAESMERPTGSGRTQGAPSSTSVSRQAGEAPARLTFSDAPPPQAAAAPPPTEPSSPPPRPRFSDVPPPTLGLSSAPPSRQQTTPIDPPPAAAVADLSPPPPPGSGAPRANTALPDPAPRAEGPAAPSGTIQDLPETLAKEDAQDTPAGNGIGNVAALDQAADPAAGSAHSERIATIQFSREAAELGDVERDILRQVAALHQQRGGMIRVIGHGSTPSAADDSAEDGTLNEQISLERANVVAQELIRLGVSRQEIRAVALAGSAAAGEAGQQATEIYFVY